MVREINAAGRQYKAQSRAVEASSTVLPFHLSGNFDYQELETESEDEDLDDEVDDGAVDEPDHEEDDAPAEPAGKKAVVPVAPPKDTDRRLSKKELKKKELPEPDAVLPELGNSGYSSDAAQDENNAEKGSNPTGDGERKMQHYLQIARVPRRRKTRKQRRPKKHMNQLTQLIAT
ncbi:nucleolin-like [Oryza brachyantha]|uniref:nucleolin-like n=1 Tax=Oryza brachyantha TaxID=4533 RepID=UPI001ADC1814|nr:nucleolin-like [Oryza brachyantha]